MKYVLLLLLALTAGCSEASPRDTALRLEFASGGLCSGTAVGDDVILSAQHCFNEGDRLVKINGEPAYALKLVTDGNDHVLVRVSKHFRTWSRIGANPQVGDHVTFLGHPLGMPLTYREAYVALVTADEILYGPGAVTAPGDSGSGLFKDGVVVGVITGAKSKVIGGNYIWALTWTMPLKFTPKQLREMR